MLPRVLEPEVMDSAAEAHDYDAMDHAQVNRVFVADFLAVWDGRGQVLDVGTGTAQIPVELCRRVDGVRVVGIDLADDKQAAVVTDHDSRVIARRRVSARAWELGGLLDWAAGKAAAAGFRSVPVVCEPTG